MKEICILSLAFMSVFSLAQDVEFKSANFKNDKEGFKKALENFEMGNEAWDLGTEAVFMVRDPEFHYKKALGLYQKAYKFNPKSAELNFKMGVAYANLSIKEKSIKYLKAAYGLNPEVDPFMNYYMGFASQLEHKFDDALKYYKKFEAEYRKADRFSKFVKQRKSECISGKKLVASPIRVWIDNVSVLNSEFDDYAPSITMDGEEILFTSDRPNGHTPDENGTYDDDIYGSTATKGKWKSPKKLKGKINSQVDDICNTVSYSGTKMLMNKLNDNGNYDIYESFLKGATWSEPVSFSKDINLKSNEKYAAYDYNDKFIYYSKDKESGSNGYDIYVTGPEDKKTRSYSLPTRLGEVNSRFNDGPIYLHADGKTMYFCSEGYDSMGGYDIFVSKKEKGIWGKPVNLGYPINTPYDDFFFAITANDKYAYIASNRAEGKGGLDIYKVTFWGEEKTPALTSEDFLLASIAKPIADPDIMGGVKVTSSANLTVFKGKTLNALTKKAVEAVIEITDNQSGKVVQVFTTNSATGKFLISLNSGGNYGIAVKADGYLFHSENFDIPSGSAYNMVNKTIELKNIKIGSKIALRNIFFDTGKSMLRSESYTELDRLVKLLKDVPGLKIELSGHTDNTGSASGNIKLSQARAEAVVAYLKSKGIASNRTTAKGYGSNKPVASNDTSDGRQENRRTEFEITGN